MQSHQRLNAWAQNPKCMDNAFANFNAKRLAESMFQSWNVIPFQRPKQRAHVLDADQFIWSQLRFLNESSKDHSWIGFFVQSKLRTTRRQNYLKILKGFELQNTARQLSLRQQCPNVVGLSINFLISSALSGSSDPTLQIFNLYKDYKLHSWWCWCGSCAANVVLVGLRFSLITSTSVFQNPLQHSLSVRFQKRWNKFGVRDGWLEPNLTANLGLKKLAQH